MRGPQAFWWSYEAVLEQNLHGKIQKVGDPFPWSMTIPAGVMTIGPLNTGVEFLAVKTAKPRFGFFLDNTGCAF